MANSKTALEVLLTLKDDLTDGLSKANNKLKKFSADVGAVGAALTTISAVPTAIAVASTKAAIEWESAFTGVRKTVDASEAEFEQLSNNIRNMSKQMPVAANDLAGIMEIAGQLGVRGVEELTKFTETIAKIAETTNLTTEEAATDFAQIANIMNEPMKNVDRMGATVVALGNNFATTERDIVAFSKRIAGAGKIANLRTKDIFAIGTAFSSVGIEAEAGGTAVQKVLMAMTQAAQGSTGKIVDNTKAIAKNTDKLNDLQNKLQVAKLRQSEFTEKTSEATRVANQNTIDKYTAQIATLSGELETLNATNGQVQISTESFASVLGMTNAEYSKLFQEHPEEAFAMFVQKLGEAGPKAFDILDELGLKDQRLIRGFESLAQNQELLKNALDMGNSSWAENIALTEEAAKRFETTESKIEIAKNKVDDIAESIGGGLKDALSEALEDLSPLLDAFADFVKEHPELVKTCAIVTVAITGVGTAMLALAGVAAVASVLVNSALWPITLPVIAITAVVALLYVAWQDNWGGIREITQQVCWTISDIIEGFLTLIKGLFTFNLTEIQEGWNQMWFGIDHTTTKATGDVREAIAHFTQSTPNDFISYADKLKTVNNDLTNDLTTSTSVMTDTMNNSFRGYFDKVPSGFIEFGNKLISTNQSTFNTINTDTTSFSSNIVSQYTTQKDSIEAVTSSMFSGINNAYKVSANINTSETQTMTSQVISEYRKMADVLVGHSVVPDMCYDIVKEFEQMPNRSEKALESTIPSITMVYNNTWQSVENELSAWIGKLNSWGYNCAKAFADGFGALSDLLESKIQSSLDNASRSLEGHSPPIAGPFQDIDKWGVNVGKAWAFGVQEGIATLRLPDLRSILTRDALMTMPTYNGSGSYDNSVNNSHNSTITIENVNMESGLDVEAVAQYIGATVANAVY